MKIGDNVRCDVDDLIFTLSTNGEAPNGGHIDCHGPKCREKFAVNGTPEQKQARAKAQQDAAQKAVDDAQKQLDAAKANAAAAGIAQPTITASGAVPLV